MASNALRDSLIDVVVPVHDEQATLRSCACCTQPGSARSQRSSWLPVVTLATFAANRRFTFRRTVYG